MSGVVLERLDGVALIRIDRPPVNALSLELLGELRDAIVGLGSDLPGAVVVTGSERTFSAGADVAELGGPRRAEEVADAFRRALDPLAALPRATIAAIAGPALGGGLELALACDLRVAEKGSRFGQPEVQLGIFPGAGATQRLARLIGPARAKWLIFTGDSVSADEARRIGLVDEVVVNGRGLSEALALARRLAAGPVAAHGPAKPAIDEGADRSLAAGLDLERQLFVQAAGTADAAVGLRRFREHGPGRTDFVGH